MSDHDLDALDDLFVDVNRPRTLAQRRESGRAARNAVPRKAHEVWSLAHDRRDPVEILEAQNQARVQWLIPVRHARMLASPLAFYRGSAAIMAADLGRTPSSGFRVQANGDAHLLNFGAYASPGDELVVDAISFDETLPGPWEWDLKRLSASIVVAGTQSGQSPDTCRTIAAHAAKSYRRAMLRYAEMSLVDLWRDRLANQTIRELSKLRPKERKMILGKFSSTVRQKTDREGWKKLIARADTGAQIRDEPPVLLRIQELPDEYGAETMLGEAMCGFERYIAAAPDQTRYLLARFKVVDVALKVDGVSRVGTRRYVFLLTGRNEDDTLFLQLEESGPSVLEDQLLPSSYSNQGQRVVEGQRLLQAQSDTFLGWVPGQAGRQYYLRQLRAWKGPATIAEMTRRQLRFHSELCGDALARGHARSGDSVAIASYLGTSTEMDDAIAEFSVEYGEQSLRDYEVFRQAIYDGRLPVSAAGD